MAVKENLKKDEETYYEKSDVIGNYLAKQRNNAVLSKLRGHVVDLGCGDNFLLSQYDGKGTGVDITDYGNTDLVLENFNSLPIDNDSIDTVTIVGSLNYFEEPISVLTEVRRILKDDGQLVITMPNSVIMKVWHKIREKWAFKSGYSYGELKQLMQKSGLKIEKHQAFLFGLNFVYVIKKA